MSWIFDALQVGAALCAIPMFLFLTTEPTGQKEKARGALAFFVLAMALDFLGSLPGLGVGDKSAFGQDVIEPFSHLAIVGVLVLGLYKHWEISGRAFLVLVGLGLGGFVCSTFVGEDTTVRHLANGLLPAFNWLVTALCVVSLVRLSWPGNPQRQFDVLLAFGLVALAAATAQHELIAQWAQGNAHYPVLE